MARANFLALSLGVHLALVGGVWVRTSREGFSHASASNDHRAMLLEGPPLEVERGEANAASAPSLPSEAPHEHAPHEEGAEAKRPTTHASAATTSPKGPPTVVEATAGTSSSAEGAPVSLFGTVPLRALLVSLSARAELFEAPAAPLTIAYDARAAEESGREGLVRVRPSHEGPTADAVAKILRRYLAHAIAGGAMSLAGSITLETRATEGDDGVFAITCDERAGRGSVRFTNGHRLELEAR